jgi:hypothetical protein
MERVSPAWQRQADVPGSFTDEAMQGADLRRSQPEAFDALHESLAAPIYNLASRRVDSKARRSGWDRATMVGT